MPNGRKPPWDQRLVKLACEPKSPTWKRITPSPATMSARMVTILMSANQNSSSPNTRTARRLAPYSTMSAASGGTHCGIQGSQKRTYTPMAVISAITVAIHMNQYDQPVTKPENGPQNSSAYVAKEPATGR